MSKRRHKEVASSEHHAQAEHEHHEHHEHHEKAEEHAPKETAVSSKKPMRLISFVVIAAVFLGIGYLLSSMAGLSTAKAGDQLIFISPPGCTNCAKLEPMAKAVADTLKIPFVKTGFGQQIQNPGFLLVYHDISTISGVEDEYTFKTQICLITNDTDVCNQAKNLTPSTDNTQQQENIPKADKTNVKFFVMSYCPYGNQAEAGLIPVYQLLKDKVEWEPHYVIYANYQGGGPNYCIANGSYCSMHGIQELNEDIREMCIWKYETHDKFFDFLNDVNTACNSGNVDTCWEAVAKNYSINTDKIKQCQNDEGVAIAKAEFELNTIYGVQGSPTVLINDGSYNGGRTPEDYKAAICLGFNTPPAECQQTLSGGGTASNTAAGGCG